MTYAKIFITFLIVVGFYAFAVCGLAYTDTLKWGKVPCAGGYKVVFEGHVFDVGNVTEFNLESIELDECRVYTFHVVAYNKYGDSASSLPCTYVRVTEKPTVVHNVRYELSRESKNAQ